MLIDVDPIGIILRTKQIDKGMIIIFLNLKDTNWTVDTISTFEN